MSNLINFLYNEDRAIASLDGAPPQETISSEVGRVADGQEKPPQPLRFIAKALAWALNKIQPGHTAAAITHANALDAVDNGVEK